ncbi:uncharacterized protein LOC127705045 isoform X6 [Mytilus californianus]|uniref:uncharacterized protein LOC127705045 isoform X3 n=1 Tax=Mytilus californianus TaxID=6549 RepID=UPI00224767B3|nr:uncharacterized protein LOC127705045 isoform X3 [Mytilus californianus]XP_052065260.1 uncharacterized protein LOC127705045 isoform X4 [Mytilus californianus]XP_052065261.1 uncharacterized protein LOC127705045 isoform X5 [Mytilus californianus]XP_052065262.1 uncharacterized protein LOC127705045 isoform X6 [Mytilus californianus]
MDMSSSDEDNDTTKRVADIIASVYEDKDAKKHEDNTARRRVNNRARRSLDLTRTLDVDKNTKKHVDKNAKKHVDNRARRRADNRPRRSLDLTRTLDEDKRERWRLDKMISWNKKLLTAATEGNIKEVELCVKNGASLECKDDFGKTPLMYAAYRGHMEIVSNLATHGCNLEAEDMDGARALHYAAENGQIEIAIWLTEHRCSPWVKTRMGQTPYDKVTIKTNDSKREKLKKKQVKDFLQTAMIETPEDNIHMLNRLTGKGTYESFDMRCMVTGQFAVGKSSLVKLLVGDVIPEGRHPTDGISLLEGRCGLDVETKQWIIIDPETYDPRDVVYQKVLMTPDEREQSKSTDPLETLQASLASPYKNKDDNRNNPGALLQQSQAMSLDPPSYTSDDLSNRSPAALSLSPQKKMKAKITKDDIRRKMEILLQSGKYRMKIGQLIFWDFGGQYVYYTTHQTFMTYRALFLVVFDGSKGLHEQVPDVMCFPGQHMTPTPAVFLQHWVNCILTYCKAVYTGIPKILFVATHKDKIPREIIDTQRESVYIGIEELFKDHEGRHHLVLDKRIFVNATDKSDPEIEILKKAITDLTFEHPCWGEKMPNACVPLELEIAELVADGKQILSLTEVQELNAISKVSVLSPEQLRDFLHFQHSLGKIVYFNTPQLRDYVIISPLLLVEVMRSFVTDVEFWPKRGSIRNTFEKMSRSGIIQRRNLYLIWEQKHFEKILPYKEFIFDMLIHLDILSEQRRYDTKTGSRLQVENYFVPCMLTKRNETGFITQECTPEKAISLAFVFKGTIIPPAFPNRLISACLSMWTTKIYKGRKLLFSGFIGLSFNKVHDIVVCVEGNRILLYIVHKTSNGLIVPDIATGIKGCMFNTLERISEFYKSTVHATPSSHKLPFHIKYGCSKLGCYITEETALTTDEWICDKHKILHTKEKWNVWNQDQAKEQCEENCPGLQDGALSQIPSDIELQRLVSRCDGTTIRKLAIYLGMTFQEWEDLRCDYDQIQIVKLKIMVNWRDKYKGRFGNIAKALTDMKLTTHMLCQAKRIRKGQYDISEENMDVIPTDEILDELAQVIGVVAYQLGIELGLSITSLDTIQYNNRRNLVAQCKEILFKWKDDQRVRPTIAVLINALVNVGRGTQCLEEIIKSIGVHSTSGKIWK